MSEEKPDVFMVKDGADGPDFAVRLGTDEQLARLHADLYAQYQSYRAQAIDLLSKAENALSGANLIAYEIDRRTRVNSPTEH